MKNIVLSAPRGRGRALNFVSRLTAKSGLAVTALMVCITLPVRSCAVPKQAALAQSRAGASSPTAKVGNSEDAKDTVSVAFTFVADSAVKTVSVAGSFNHWSRTTNFLTKQPDGKTWLVVLSLEPGVYTYKFVIDGSKWLTDPNAPTLDDGTGNINSQLTLLPDDYTKQPGKTGDGIITLSGVRHKPNAQFVRRTDAGHIELMLRTRHDDVQSCAVEVLLEDKTAHRAASQSADVAVYLLTRYRRDTLFDYWRADVPVPKNGVLRYSFRLADGSKAISSDGSRAGSKNGSQARSDERIYDARGTLSEVSSSPRRFMVNAMDFPPFEVPDWARDAVFYQIFPDRFADGDKANDPPTDAPFGAKPEFDTREGGDLQGVTQHFDYLRDLGINALYFNPLFTSRSSHGYDTTDYLHIDPRFGTDDVFKKLVAHAHRNKWHVILDGVFNHTGVDFKQFASLRTEGEKSPYRDWYFVHHFPIEVKDGQTSYDGWFGTPWLPKLNVVNPDTRKFLLDVATRWITETKIDGWRLDAADEVEHAYWQEFRKAVRRADPKAYLVGEIWSNAHDWLQGDQFDAVMNYRWRGAALDYFAFDKTKPTEFDAALRQIRDDYPPAATGVMFNMLGSHDVERLRTLCGGSWAKQKQSVLFQMTYPGTPCIYYGDEIGMEGGKDPDNRRAMEWDKSKWDKEAQRFYRQILRLRKEKPILRRGDYKTVYADDSTAVFGYTRTRGNQEVLVLFNRGDLPQTAAIPLEIFCGKPYTDWLHSDLHTEERDGNLLVSLPERGIAVLGTP